MVDAKDKVQVEARPNRNQLIMFSTIIAFIDLLDYPPVSPARGQYSKGHKSISSWKEEISF